jgi:hypothetical protein
MQLFFCFDNEVSKGGIENEVILRQNKRIESDQGRK